MAKFSWLQPGSSPQVIAKASRFWFGVLLWPAVKASRHHEAPCRGSRCKFLAQVRPTDGQTKRERWSVATSALAVLAAFAIPVFTVPRTSLVILPRRELASLCFFLIILFCPSFRWARPIPLFLNVGRSLLVLYYFSPPLVLPALMVRLCPEPRVSLKIISLRIFQGLR